MVRNKLGSIYGTARREHLIGTLLCSDGLQRVNPDKSQQSDYHCTECEQNHYHPQSIIPLLSGKFYIRLKYVSLQFSELCFQSGVVGSLAFKIDGTATAMLVGFRFVCFAQLISPNINLAAMPSTKA